MSDQQQLSFEEALNRLQEIVDKLDDETLALETSVELYEEGITLSKQCTQTLEEAELRIEKVDEEHSQG